MLCHKKIIYFKFENSYSNMVERQKMTKTKIKDKTSNRYLKLSYEIISIIFRIKKQRGYIDSEVLKIQEKS
jgi:hypothetical protein